MIDFERLITALSDAGVDFVIVGGVAATLHGSARLIDMLLKMKRAAGRPKDLEVISELETIRALGSSDE